MNKLVLNNGIRVVTEELPHFRSIALGIWVKTGSRHEQKDQNGISHFIEHMLFKGSEKYNVKAIAEIFDGMGGMVNAYTSKEYTCYYIKVIDEHLDQALEVLSDMLFRPALDEQELVKERHVIEEEIAMYDDTPDDFVHDLIASAAYGDDPLAYPILGTEETISSLSADDLRQYMLEHYHSGHIVISAAGRIDERSLQLIRQYFDVRLPKKNLKRPKFSPYYGKTMFHQKNTEQNHICLALPGVSYSDPDLYEMICLNNLLGGGMSSRLFQEIREKRGLAYSVYSYHCAYEDSGLWTVYIGTAPKQTKEVLHCTFETIQDFISSGVGETELERCKQQLKGNLLLGMESTSSRMNQQGKNELMRQEEESIAQMIAKIEAITAAGLRQMTDQLFSHRFAAALVGSSDEAMKTIRRDPLVHSD